MGEHFQIKIRSDHQHIPVADNAVFRTYLVWVARLFEIGPVWPVKQPRGQLRVTSPSLQLYSFNDAGSEGIMQRRNAGNPEAARANVRVGHIPIIPVSRESVLMVLGKAVRSVAFPYSRGSGGSRARHSIGPWK